MQNWGWEEEFKGIELGDERLYKRLMRVTEDLSSHPQFPINQASEDWHAAKAAYRLFENDKLNAQKILEPHIQRTVERCCQEDFVIVLQDMTVVGYSRHQAIKNVGLIGGNYRRSTKDPQGINMHVAMAINPKALPLGLLSNNLFTRPPEDPALRLPKQERERLDHLIPTDDKESYKWIDALEQTHQALGDKVRSVTVCDRESDFHDFYLSADSLGMDVVVRANADRQVGTRQSPQRLSEKLLTTTAFSEKMKIQIPTKTVGGGKSFVVKKREAALEVKVTEIVLSPSRKLSQVVKENVTLRAVEIKEVALASDIPGDNIERLHWILFTTLKVTSFEEAKNIATIYALRWKIEEYFKVLKSGCSVEKCRLNDGEKLKKFLALKSIIAWRLFFLTFVQRVAPNDLVTSILSKQEIVLLHKKYGSKLLLDDITVKQAFIWIARLGGYLARNNDGPPGITSIWRGWSRLQDMAFAFDTSNNFSLMGNS
jgi:hypothetical protein